MLPADNLELLMPGAAPARIARARKLVTLLRMVSDEGRRGRAGSVRVTLERARGELEAHVRRRLSAALLDLLRHWLYAEIGEDGFAWHGEPVRALQEAWSAIEEHRDELPWLPSVPAPHESSSSVVERMLEAAARLGWPAREVELWRARSVRASLGPERGEAAFRALIDGAAPAGEPGGSPPFDAIAVEATCGLAECLLDRGAVRAARQVLQDRADRIDHDPRARRLRSWTSLLLEDEPAARAADADTAPWSGRIPPALAELRAAVPSWLPLLAGKAPAALSSTPSSTTLDSTTPSSTTLSSTTPSAMATRSIRRACGAVLAAVFALEDAGRHRVLEWDAAPALRERASQWLRALEGIGPEPDSPEHRAIVEAAQIVLHADPQRARSPLPSSPQVRALAVVPILDEEREVAGWVRLEWEHHLVPSAARLAAVARAWRERALACRAGADPARRGGPPNGVDWTPPAGDGPCAEVFRELVHELAMKTAQRRWWAFEVDGRNARWIASGGAGPGERREERGGARALRRALRSAGPVRFDEPDPALALSRDSASGLVLPLAGAPPSAGPGAAAAAELCGLLAIESTRRKDFPAALAQRWQERASARAIELRIARFREWHRARFGQDVHFSAGGAATPWIAQVFAAARSRVCCTVFGAPGSGKHVVARWLHHERRHDDRAEEGVRGHRPERALVFLPCGDEREPWPSPRTHGGATVVLDRVERLSDAGQARLVAELDGPGDAPGTPRNGLRWIVIASSPLDELAQRGTLRADLVRRLEKLQVRVPSLCERREELPKLISVLAQRFAAEERCSAPSFDDEALALLWRQPWNGNVRELENLLFKVVLLHAGREVHAADLEEIARRFRFELVRRIASRQPDPEVVRAALASTLNLRGTINKTRAAMYLGWDPDTLVTRMIELGLLERGLEPQREIEPQRETEPQRGPEPPAGPSPESSSA